LWIHEPLPERRNRLFEAVVPGQDLGLHGVRVQLFVPLDHLGSLVAVDGRRLAVRLDDLAPVTPQHRPERDVRVGAVADRDADRVALLLEDLPGLEQVVPGLRRLDPGLLELHLVVAPRKRDPVPRHRPPPRRRLTRFLGERVPAAVTASEEVDEIADVDELLLVKEGVGGAGDDDVVARLRRNLCCPLGKHLGARDRVEPNGHAGLLGEDLGLPFQLVVRHGHEVVE
jgi:hypothetical protein